VLDLDPLDFFATLDASPGVSVVVFVKPGCGACRAMKAALTQLEQRGFAGLLFVVDGEDGPGLVADYEIFHFPALFVWRDGHYHAQIQAPPQVARLEHALAEALAGPAEPEP